MALDVDTLLDRRRQARRISFWRGLAFLLVFGAIGAALFAVMKPGAIHVARLPITGAIVSDRPLVTLIERLGRDDKVAGVVVAIDSPGGTTVGGERLYAALRTLAERKPVTAHINTLGASAAYMAALATDHIVAQRTSLTGSIGVLVQFGDVSELLKDLGISIQKVDSGPLKAEPNPFEPTDPAAVAMLQSVVDDTYDWFLSLVVERRGIPQDEARRLADGRIFTGNQALGVNLVDDIGDESRAIAWMQTERGMSADLPIRTYTTDDDGDFSFTARLSTSVIRYFFAAFGIIIPDFATSASVDGLWSVWHGSISSDAKGDKE